MSKLDARTVLARGVKWAIVLFSCTVTYFAIITGLHVAHIEPLLLMRGISSHLPVLLFLSFVAALIPFSGWLVTLLWSCVLAGNAEHIEYSGTHLIFGMWEQGINSVFITDSALAPTVLSKLGLIFATAICVYFVCEKMLPQGIGRLWQRWLAAGLFLMAVPAFIITSQEEKEWLDSSMIEYNSQFLIGSKNWVLPAMLKRRWFAYPSQDLSAPRLIAPEKKPNILLIAVEGLSDVYVTPDHMPWLASMREKGLYAPQFATLNGGTNNGLLALHCGRYPFYIKRGRLRELDWLIRKNSWEENNCLAGYLRKIGYDTLFLKSANLGFMGAGKFMRHIGFQTVKGQFQLEGEAARWGLNDKTFYENALKQMQEWKGNKNPWFISLMTSSTHHPYNFPGKEGSVDVLRDAYLYADNSLQFLYQQMEALGLLENTLVIITTDESRASSMGESFKSNSFVKSNRGFFLALTPNRDKRQNPALFTQADVPLTILDYAGIDPAHFAGRSILRHYTTPRLLFIANLFHRRIVITNRPDSVKICFLKRQITCKDYSTKTGNIFEASPSD